MTFELSEYLSLLDYEASFKACSNNCNDMAAIFQDIFQSILDIHAPAKRKRLRCQTASWITPLIRGRMKGRDAAKRDIESCPEKNNL